MIERKITPPTEFQRNFIKKIGLAVETLRETEPIISKLPASISHIRAYDVSLGYINGIMAFLTAVSYASDYKATRREKELKGGALNLDFGQAISHFTLLKDLVEDIKGFGFAMRQNRIESLGHPIGGNEIHSRLVDLILDVSKEYFTAHNGAIGDRDTASRLRLKRAESIFYGIRDTYKAILAEHDDSYTALLRASMARVLPEDQISVLLGESRSYDSTAGSIS